MTLLGSIRRVVNHVNGLVMSRDSAGSSVISPRRGGSGYLSALGDAGSNPMTIAAVYRCVQLLADSVANLPLQYKADKGDGVYVPCQSPMLELLNIAPDDVYNAVDFWRLVVSHVLLNGNGYIVPVYDEYGGGLLRLALCNPWSVSHDTLRDVYTVVDGYNGVLGVYGPDGIIHIRGKASPSDPKRGVSVLSYARQTVGIASTAQGETRERFANGGSVRGILANDKQGNFGYGEYNVNEMRNQAADIDSRFRDGERVVSVAGDVKFQQVALSAADMQFLESRKFTNVEICRFFGVPPSFIFEDTASNYKSAEMANVAFLSNTLNPILRSIEVELTRKLVAPELWRWRRIEFDRFGLYAADLDTQAKYISQTIGNGGLTVNEARALRGMPRVDGGDAPLVSANYKTLAELTAGQNKGE